MKKLFLPALALVLCISSSKAVLNEKNLAQTLSVLRIELMNTYKEQRISLLRINQMNEIQHQSMIAIMQQSDQVALMLYSQKQDYTFDLTYACHEATEQFRQFRMKRMPYDKILQKLNTDINRYNGMITTLQQLPPSLIKQAQPQPKPGEKMPPRPKGKSLPFMLSKQGQADRAACLSYAIAIRDQITMQRNNIIKDNEHYERVSLKLKEVNDYAIHRYRNIQQSIFVNGDDTYFSTLKRFSRAVSLARQDVNDKYQDRGYRHTHSEWRGPIVIGLIIFVIFYLIIATILSNVIVRVMMRNIKSLRTEEFQKKKFCLILAAGVFIFAISIMIVRGFMDHNFFIMASGLLVQFAWLLGAILASLLIRLKGDQIKSGFRIYSPIMLMSFIIIAFRIIFIPNRLVNLIFPPILLVFTLWQLNVIRRHNINISRNDIFFTWISLAVMTISCAFSWFGYVLLAVQLIIWWMFQLAAIQTITCCYDLLRLYKAKVLDKKIAAFGAAIGETAAANASEEVKEITAKRKKGTHIRITWFYDLLSMAFFPVLGVLSVLWCIWWAAAIFDLTDACFSIFMTPFVNLPGVCQLSLFKIVLVVGMFFIFRYINYAIRNFYQDIKLSSLKRKAKTSIISANETNFTLSNNITTILVWGIYIIFTIVLLKVPKSGISIVTAGLATGVGFAMKDLLENFFYGVSLMAGRLRVGDYIECDSIRGKVDSITYQSTQIATADGCIIAFLNSSLFSKNFKNLTRNHSYEMVKIPVGIAYGANVEEVRKLLLNAVKSMLAKDASGRDIISESRGINVLFNDFGDNSINLDITFWVLVEDRFTYVSKVKEIIYDTLTEHHIEIPYPQRDIYIRQMPDKK